MRAIACGLVLALATSTLASDGSLPRVRRGTLDNGLRVIIAEYHELPLVELSVLVGAGATQDPPGKEGLAALVAATVTRGAGDRSARELAAAVESLGGELDASAGRDGTIVRAEFLAKDLGEGLGLLHDVLLDPTLARDEVRRAREAQAARIVATLEHPSAIVAQCLDAFLYGPHPYGRPVHGSRDSVARLGRGDARDFWERWYRPNNTILVLVGDVDTADALIRLRERFGAWRPGADAVPGPPPAPAPVRARRVLLVDKPDATQTQIRFAGLAIPRAHPDFLVASVANTILGGGFTSKLVEELRVKRSLTYGAWSRFSGRRTTGEFTVGTFTKTETTAETTALALSVTDEFRTSPPEPAALEKAKAYLRGQFPLRLERPEALAAQLAEMAFHGLPDDALVTYPRRLEAVTAADVARVSRRRIPAPDGVAVVVVGRAADVREPLVAALGPVEESTPVACVRRARMDR